MFLSLFFLALRLRAADERTPRRDCLESENPAEKRLDENLIDLNQ